MPLTLTKALLGAGDKFRDTVCIQFKKESGLHRYSYREIIDSSLKIGTWLARRGIQKGDRVALAAENRPEWSICYFGILFSDAIAVPLDVQTKAEEAEYILKDCGCRMIFVSSSFGALPGLEKILPEAIVLIDEKNPSRRGPFLSEILEHTPLGPVPAAGGPGDLASIIYTSGTTGFPKGVMLTHANFLANYESILKVGLTRRHDNVLSLLPIHHTYAFTCTLLVPLFVGATITYLDTFKTDQILRCFTEEEITVMPVVPQIMNLFYQGISERIRQKPWYARAITHLLVRLCGTVRAASGLNLGKIIFAQVHSRFGKRMRVFVSGGAKLDESVARFFFALGINILEGYGLTETAPVVSFNPPGHAKIGSVGKKLKGITVSIAASSSGDGIGEILVQGPNVMKGYYRRETETAEVLKGGWLHTGDLGFLDKDGYLYIKGRQKEIIVLSSGKNISPEEVETHYLRAPEIKEMAVLADETEEKLTALIIPDEDYFRKTGKTDIHGIIKWRIEFLSETLPSYKRIRGFIFCKESLPRTRLGKMKRMEVREIYRKILKAGQPTKETPSAEITSSPCREKVFEILKTISKAPTISLDDHLELDLGLDSLGKIETLVALEKAFHLKSDETDFSKIFRVRELVELVEKTVGGAGQVEGGEGRMEWKKILQAEFPEDLKKQIDLKSGRGALFFMSCLDALAWPFVKLFFRLEVAGAENIPEGGVILCPNHVSYMDGPIVHLAVPRRLRSNLFFVGIGKFFNDPAMRPLTRLSRVIPLDASTNIVEALKTSAYVIGRGKILCLFPEGGRSATGELREPKKGAGILAKELNLKVVPVYINGTYEAWKPTAFLPRPFPVKVTFGSAYSWEDLKQLSGEPDTTQDYEAISRGIKEAMKRLKNDE